MKKGNPLALLPIGVFLVLYLGLGLLFEYGMHIPMGFYNVPIIIAFLAAILVACLQNRKVSFDTKLEMLATTQEKEKAFNDVLLKVKENSLEYYSSRLGSDVTAINQVIEGKKALETLKRTHISFQD